MNFVGTFILSSDHISLFYLLNARIREGKELKERIRFWQKRGLFIFCLPTYSPHLNIAETGWQKLKYEWLAPTDYENKERLKYAVKQALNEFGRSLRIKFSNFKHSLT
jgi:transposase